ncbi:MAG: transposase [Candidatus Limnocylindrales bacterium]
MTSRRYGVSAFELAAAVSAILHATMEDELAALLAGSAIRALDRSSRLSQRPLPTPARDRGAIELSVPRVRQIAYRPSFLERAARRTSTVDELLRTASLRGLSTREMAALAERLTGVSLSAAAVSRLTAQLDSAVAAFFIGGRSACRCATCSSMAYGSAVRGSSGHASKRVVLAAYGISADGHRELLD